MTTDYRHQVAVRVREQRGRLGWSQEQLAARWGRSRHTVLRLERNDLQPELGLLEGLAGVFGMTLVEFLAPVLQVEDREVLVEEAHKQARLGVAIRTNALLEREGALLDRPHVRSLVHTVALACQDMTDDQVEWERRGWELRRAQLWSESRRPIAVDSHKISGERQARRIVEEENDGETR
jgi:transcriptional regulator with XRE-family HTH domain